MLISLIVWAEVLRSRTLSRLRAEVAPDIIFLRYFGSSLKEELQKWAAGAVLVRYRERFDAAVDEITELEAELQSTKDELCMSLIQFPNPDVRDLQRRLDAAERRDDELAQELLDARCEKAEGLERERALRERIEELLETISLSSDAAFIGEVVDLVRRIVANPPRRSRETTFFEEMLELLRRPNGNAPASRDTIIPPAAEEGAA